MSVGHGKIAKGLATVAGLAATSITLTLALASPASASSGIFDRAWGWNVNGGGVFGICTVAADCQKGTQGGLGGQFNFPGGVAVDPPRNAIWVADNGNNRIEKFDLEGNFISAWGKDVDASNPSTGYEGCLPPSTCQAGTAGGGIGELNGPVGIATDAAGNVWVADTGNNRVWEFQPLSGLLTPQFAFGKDVAVGGNTGFEICGPETSVDCQSGDAGGLGGEMNLPEGITFDAAGNIYVADFGNNRIQRYNPNSLWQRAWGKGVDTTTPGDGFEICTAASGHTCQAGGQGGHGGEMDFPSDVAIGPFQIVYVADSGNNRIQGFDLLGNWQIAWGRDVNASNSSSSFELCTAASGDTCQAGAVGSAEGEMFNPSAVATDGTEAVYVADTNNNRVQKFSFSGILTWGTAGTAGGEFNLPFGIAGDTDGSVWVADSGNNRIQKFAADPAGPLPPPDESPAGLVPGTTQPLTPPAPSTTTNAKRKCKKGKRLKRGKCVPKKRKKPRL
jgi:tripartite motif-containing protein 71